MNEVKKNDYRRPLIVVTSLFFMWGFLTSLNDILIPHLKGLFDLSYTKAMLVQFCFFFAYFLMSIPSGKLVHRVGYKTGMIIGLVIASLGTLSFYPAAQEQSFVIFLIGFFILASGITLLQVAANPYVVVLGPEISASSRLNLTQAFNSLGTTIAPAVGAVLILSNSFSNNAERAAAVQVPYLFLSLALLALALMIYFFRLPKISDDIVNKVETGVEAAKKSAWHYPHLVLGAIAIFVYVGGEVSIGSFLINFLSQPDIAGFSAETAGKYVSLYWGGAMVGRFIGVWVLRKIQSGKVLAFNAAMVSVLLIITMLSTGQVATVSILSIGLFNSIMFPTIFSLAIRKLGEFTSQGSGILCSAIVGGAIVPVIQGALADTIGIHYAFFIPLLCYFYILFYGVRGYRLQENSQVRFG